MFDPTAFDNMKVVVEGALYDLDLSGEIVIKDRNDSINLAKMSRRFDISFHLSEKKQVSAKVELKSSLANLAAELLPAVQSEQKTGCELSLQYLIDSQELDPDYTAINTMLMDIWGPNRTITQSVLYDPLKEDPTNALTIRVGFERLIREDQMDDLVEMIEFIITTLQKLTKTFSK